MLIDTGSDISLINEKMLHHMGVDKSRIQPGANYSIQSSSNMVHDATIGNINLHLHIISSTGELIKAKVPFVVAHEKLDLQKIILGNTFLSHHDVKIEYKGKGN